MKIQEQIAANLASLQKVRAANKWMRETLATATLPIPYDKEEGDAPEVRWLTRGAVDPWDFYETRHWRKDHMAGFHKIPIQDCPWCYRKENAKRASARRRERIWNILSGRCALCHQPVYPYTRAKFVKMFGGRSASKNLRLRMDEDEIRREYAILCLTCYRDHGRKKLWDLGVKNHLPMLPFYGQGRYPKVIRPSGEQVLVSRPRR